MPSAGNSELHVPTEVRHYHRRVRRPFLNLSDLDGVELDRVIADLADERSAGESERVFGRQYMELRRRTEALMRERFVTRGGRPLREAPHYFVLGSSPWFEGSAPDIEAVVLPLADLPGAQTSFTYPDSFTAMGLLSDYGLPHEPRPYHGEVFRLTELGAVLAQYGMPVDPGEAYEGYAGRPFELYIEVQLWSDEPIERWLV